MYNLPKNTQIQTLAPHLTHSSFPFNLSDWLQVFSMCARSLSYCLTYPRDFFFFFFATFLLVCPSLFEWFVSQEFTLNAPWLSLKQHICTVHNVCNLYHFIMQETWWSTSWPNKHSPSWYLKFSWYRMCNTDM